MDLKSEPVEERVSRRVLLLDDDPTTLFLLSSKLQAFGMDVIACREIEAAEAILDHSRVDAVITDLCVSPLGGLDGTRLVKHVASHFPETDLLVMSAHSNDAVRRLVLAFGASAFFEKPVDPQVVALQILRGRPPAPAQGAGQVQYVEFLDEFLAKNPIFAALQPIVDLQSSSFPLHGLECLARGPQDSLLKNPEILFEYASRKERLYDADMLCIRAGLAEARAAGGGHTLFLNVQPRSMSNPAFPGKVLQRVQEAGYRPGDVVFELVEHQTILNPRAFGATLAQIRKLGFRVAMDDFGVGFCNLNLLLDLKPEYVKLPRYFTKGIHADSERQQIVASLRSLVGKFGMPIIMEGIETPEELETVRSLGVEYAQGYYFSRPQRARDLVQSRWFTQPVSTVAASAE